jgi:uncharacterized protein (DUF983 family)
MALSTNPKSPALKKVDNRFWTLYFNALRLRCPVCKKGRIFPGWFKVEDHCPVCGIEIERGEGFFLGSIYFNYGSTGLLMLVSYVTCRLWLGWPDRYIMPALTVFALVYPMFFLRFARSSFLAFDQYFNPRLPPEPASESQ